MTAVRRRKRGRCGLYTKIIGCLANSRRPSGACVAGREWAASGPGQWIRPVSGRETREISWRECRLDDRGELRVLDVVEVTFRRHEPEGHQQENHLVHEEYYWRRVGRLDYSELAAAAENTGALWVNGHKTSYGLNDKVPEELSRPLASSLRLVRPEIVDLRVRTDGAGFDNPRRRVRAWFELDGHRYGLTVTDPVVEQRLRAQEDGYVETLRDAYLCVSLAMPYIHDNCCHKLIAAVITPNRAGA
jgi:hypothetical protein